jgi:hypothetical protein
MIYINIVQNLGLMHLVSGFETYKIVSGVVTQALGRIIKHHMKCEDVQCLMIFMIVDTNN